MDKKYKRGITFGVFDGLTSAHLEVLKQAKEQCEYLIVGLSDDEYVRKIKNKEPVIKYRHRKRIIKSLPFVDKVVRQRIYTRENNPENGENNFGTFSRKNDNIWRFLGYYCYYCKKLHKDKLEFLRVHTHYYNPNRWIDYAMLKYTCIFFDTNKRDITEKYQPDVIFVGSEYKNKNWQGKLLGIPVEYIKHNQSIHSSDLRK